MNGSVCNDKLVVIRVEGMHCLHCEKKIKKALLSHNGIHEVEVDFNSAQASILFDGSQSKVSELTEIIKSLGYRPTGFTMGAQQQEHEQEAASEHPAA
ncbi:MAG: heavy metal-associated domain-containing protein [Tepidisphaeraceae bacterium]|jgi:copper chaperone CopZ